jgi:hypothetical protein
MHDVILPEDFESFNDLSEYLKSSFLLESAFLFEQIMESATFAVLIHKIAIVFCLQQLEESDYMWRIL